MFVQHLEAMRTVLTDALAEVAEHQAQANAALQELQQSRAQVAVLARELRASQDLVRPLGPACACVRVASSKQAGRQAGWQASQQASKQASSQSTRLYLLATSRSADPDSSFTWSGLFFPTNCQQLLKSEPLLNCPCVLQMQSAGLGRPSFAESDSEQFVLRSTLSQSAMAGDPHMSKSGSAQQLACRLTLALTTMRRAACKHAFTTEAELCEAHWSC